MPRKPRISKDQAVENHIRRYNAISQAVALAKYGVWDLPQRVGRLKSRGLEVVRTREKNQFKYSVGKTSLKPQLDIFNG